MNWPVRYVDNGSLPAGAYGLCRYFQKEILILNTLPDCVKEFVLAHERQHERDFKARGIGQSVLWLEIKANAAGFFRHPIGGVVCVIMTLLSPTRLGFYWKRLFKP